MLQKNLQKARINHGGALDVNASSRHAWLAMPPKACVISCVTVWLATSKSVMVLCPNPIGRASEARMPCSNRSRLCVAT
eukprot:4192125-Pleurochrysis_carterae.AAC.1